MLIKRPAELKLFLINIVFLVMFLLFLFLTDSLEKINLYTSLAVIVLGTFTTIFLNFKFEKSDQILFPLAFSLSLLGVLGIHTISPALAFKQMTWIAIGLVIFNVILIFLKDYNSLHDFKYLFMLGSIFFLGITALLGTRIGGAKAWLTFGSFRFQPVELVKLFNIFFLASYLEENREILSVKKNNSILPEQRSFIPLAIMLVLSLALLVLQKDLGAAMIFFGVFLSMIYVSTGRLSYLNLGIISFFLGSILAYYLFGHFRVRVEAWLNPWAKIHTSGYQIAQSLFAIASGGFLGSGIGLGEVKIIPVGTTDLIFPVLTQQLGMLGGIAIILLFIFFSYRGYLISINAKNEYGTLLSFGIVTLFTLQSIIILGGVMKVLPLTGVTLPFVSYGGSSIIISYIMLAFLVNISAK